VHDAIMGPMSADARGRVHVHFALRVASLDHPGVCLEALKPFAPRAAQGPGDGGPVMQTVRLGQPFDVSYPYSNGGGAAWRITLDSVRCGGGSMFDPKILDAFYSSTGEPTAIPKPDPGRQFCLTRFTVTNKSHSNDVWSFSGGATSLNVGMNAYTDNGNGPSYDPEQAYLDSLPQSANAGLNPDGGQHGAADDRRAAAAGADHAGRLVMTRAIAIALGAAVLDLAAGCGSSGPPTACTTNA
jgi:hypothetical protein